MEKLAKQFGLDVEVTKIGFKYIAEIMTQEDVVVGGEESGGLAVKGHIPERDGIWMGLLVMEFMAKTGKTIKELVADIYDMVGSFSTGRDDLRITDELKHSIIDNCKNNVYSSFGAYEVGKTENIDGYKFWLADDKWLMIRPSGTEPVLRVYAQAPDAQEVRRILDAAQGTLLQKATA
jgi:phosphomannomutase